MFVTPAVYWTWYATVLGVAVAILLIAFFTHVHLNRRRRIRRDMIQRMLHNYDGENSVNEMELPPLAMLDVPWNCGICNFSNASTKTACVLCGTERGFSLSGTLLGSTRPPPSPLRSSRSALPSTMSSRLSFVDRTKAFQIRSLNARQRRARNRNAWVRKIGPNGQGYWTRNGNGTDQVVQVQGFVARMVSDGAECRLTFADCTTADALVSFDGNGIHTQDLEVLHVVAAMTFTEKLQWFVDETNGLLRKWKDGRLKFQVHRDNVLVESLEQLLGMQPMHMHLPFCIEFVGESGLDAGGLEREWFSILTTELFDIGLFTEQNGVFSINPNSFQVTKDHLLYFKAAGRFFGRALLCGQLLTARLSLPLLKHILGVPISFEDIQFVDPQLYTSLKWMEENEGVECLDLYFAATESDPKGDGIRTIDLKPNGRDILVTDENKAEYLKLYLRYVMLDRCGPQLQHLLVGLFDIIPYEMLMVFDYQELELVLCGIPEIDVDDWEANTQYSIEMATSPIRQWFWEIVREFSSEDRARLLQFATGSARVPLQGFKALISYDGQMCPFSLQSIPFSDTAYPRAHTCFNRIDLPLYQSKDQLAQVLSLVINLEVTGFTEE